MRLATNGLAGAATSAARRVELDEPALDDHADPLGEHGGVLEVVGDEQRRESELAQQLAQLAAHLGLRVRVERGERLVEQQHLRVARERAGERDALALAAGELVGLRVRERVDVQALEQLVDARRAAVGDVLRTLMCGKSAYSWKTSPTDAVLRREVDPRSLENQVLVAERDRAPRGSVSPAIARSTVDLPAPDGPTSATVSALELER